MPEVEVCEKITRHSLNSGVFISGYLNRLVVNLTVDLWDSNALNSLIFLTDSDYCSVLLLSLIHI